jgi:ferredoxin
MKVKLDRTVCDGFGICAEHAPERFSIDEWGYASLVGTGEVLPGEEDAVRRAILDCPVHAILVLGETATAQSPANAATPAIARLKAIRP